jgi:hypothetical protein
MVNRLVGGNGAGADYDGRRQPGDCLARECSSSDREDPAGCARSTGRSCASGRGGPDSGTGAAGDVRAARGGGRAELGEKQLLDE